MNLRKIIVGCGTIILFANTDASAQTVPPGSHWPTTVYVGSNLPMIGNVVSAGKLCKEANAAADAGNLSEAKSDFQSAIVAAPFYDDAIIGLARCDATEGDLAASINSYEKIVSGFNEQYDINLLTEYILVLIEAGNSREAISTYNHVVDLVKEGRAVTKMDVAIPPFRLSGSDAGMHYSPTMMQAMTHLIRAMNAGTSDHERIASEMKQAIGLARRSSIVYFYQGVFLSHTDHAGARSAFQQALALDDGSNRQVIDKRVAVLDSIGLTVPTH